MDEMISARSELLDPAKEVKPTEPAGDVKGVGLSALSLMRQHVETLIIYNGYLRILLPCYTHRGQTDRPTDSPPCPMVTLVRSRRGCIQAIRCRKMTI